MTYEVDCDAHRGSVFVDEACLTNVALPLGHPRAKEARAFDLRFDERRDSADRRRLDHRARLPVIPELHLRPLTRRGAASRQGGVYTIRNVDALRE